MADLAQDGVTKRWRNLWDTATLDAMRRGRVTGQRLVGLRLVLDSWVVGQERAVVG